MRISDERYRRDLRRLDVAGRMLMLGARTRTVERWTALSVNRVRTLYQSYSVVEAERAAPRRGVTPFTLAPFSKSAEVRCDAALLGGFLQQFEVWEGQTGEAAVQNLPGLSRGERLCRAMEEFRALRPRSELTLEHAVALLTELTRGVEVELAKCAQCSGLMLRDRLAVGPALCVFCGYEEYSGRPRIGRKNRPTRTEPRVTSTRDRQGKQQSLL